ncbi:hypothetical protein, partial [Burkholderia pseudomallei]|uniref:hypothetical protein n=6 Tax=Burkholderia pseudomallei TaxID=28450 RepID=UPI001C7ED9A3
MTRIARAAPVASFIEAIARVWRMASRTSCGAHARTIAVLALLPTSSRFLAPSRFIPRHAGTTPPPRSPSHRRPRAQRNHADRSSAPPDSIDACARPSPTAPP